MLAELPDAVSFAQATTLPIAGLTALYTLERGGPLLGRRVLVTGASGGVGLFACQLARLGGAARVVGVVRSAEHEAVVREAGADEVIVGGDTSMAKPLAPTTPSWSRWEAPRWRARCSCWHKTAPAPSSGRPALVRRPSIRDNSI